MVLEVIYIVRHGVSEVILTLITASLLLRLRRKHFTHRRSFGPIG
jgi:hypothetical protein